jgi:hypothetical protein
MITHSIRDTSQDEYGSFVDDSNRDVILKKMFRCHFFHNKTHMYCFGIENVSLPSEFGGKLPEP